MAITLNPLKMKLPVQLVLMTLFILLLGNYIPKEVKQFCYATSLTLKEILIFVLPVIIFSYLSSCILSFKKGVIAFIIVLLTSVYLSNLLAYLASYFISYFTFDFINISKSNFAESNYILMPTWTFSLPEWFPNKQALISGLVVGVIFSFWRVKKVIEFTNILKNWSSLFLIKGFIPVVPIFVLGFIFKLHYDGILTSVILTYASVYFYTFGAILVYILLLYFIAANGNFKMTAKYVRNVLPSAIAGYSTMSSAATMPLTLLGAERNTGNVNLVRAIIPSTVNIHMIGNSMVIPFMAFAILASKGIPFPSFDKFLMYALLCCVAQFSVAAVPSGGILVMIPILEEYLSFTPDMSLLITAIYILFDTIITSTNILGNGVFAIFLGKLFHKCRIVGCD